MLYVPLVLLVFRVTGLVVTSVFWVVVLALILAIPLAVAVGFAAVKLAAEKPMLIAVADAVREYDARVWEGMKKIWNERLEQHLREERRKAQARHDRATAGKPRATPKRCPHYKDGGCYSPITGERTGMCSSSPAQGYETACSVYALFQAKLAGAGTYDALRSAGALSPFSIDTVIRQGPKAIDSDDE
ncbi:MAG: hypothetical protein HQ559_08720 [Lentisphaerae bacterium]|nr:hypothetical protein [Lentisphaerota bacterium]